MSEEYKNRTCRYCAEPIQTNAKVCPHCRQWLSVASLRNPIIFASIVSASGLFCIIWFTASFQHALNSGIDFSPYRDSISIVESRMNFQSDTNSPCVFVVVALTNKSNIAWKNIQMDLRFFNKSGTLIDALTYTGYGKIYPAGEIAFRIKNSPIRDLSEYDSYKISVSSAQDARSHF